MGASIDDVFRLLQAGFARLEMFASERGSVADRGPLVDNSICVDVKLDQALAPGGFVEITNPFRSPASVLIWDPTAGQADILMQFQANNSGKFRTLQPGKPFDIRPRAWRELKFRVLKRVGATLSVAAGTILGQLTIGTDVTQDISGGTPANAMYVRPMPSNIFTQTRSLTNIGALGIFSNRDTLPGLVDANAVEIMYEIRNTGTTDIYLGVGTAIVADNAGNRAIVARLVPGDKTVIWRRGKPANEFALTPTDDTVFVYCEDVGGSYSIIGHQAFSS